MRTSRRAFLRCASASVAMLPWSGRAFASGHAQRFEQPLPIPPILAGRVLDGVRTFELAAGRGESRFVDGLVTQTIGFNGAYLGPTLRCRTGESVRIHVKNGLQEQIAVHWHGLHVPARMDGGPHQAIAPGATWSPEFEIRQRGALYWYHAHTMHRTGSQVLRGLAGLLLVEDEENAARGLPAEYGVDDIPLVLQDRRFREDGSFEYISSMHDVMMGYRGDVLLVNGAVRPVLELKRQRTRLRILNGSNARTYTLGRDDGRDLTVIGSDGGLLQAPVTLKLVRLAPGERVELVVDAEEDRQVRLMSFPDITARGFGGMMGMGPDADVFPILQMRSGKLEKANAPLPGRLSSIKGWRTEDSTATRRFTLDMGMMGGMMGRRGMGRGMMGGMGINGLPMDMGRIDVKVPADNIEIWEIANRSPMHHPFHVHNVQFQILDRNGRPPAPVEQGLKDTVVVEAGSLVRIIASFGSYVDAHHPYMYHCHILEHEDAGMMGQFVVV